MSAALADTDEIEISRTMQDVRRFVDANKPQIDAEWNALPDGRPHRTTPELKARAEAEWSAL